MLCAEISEWLRMDVLKKNTFPREVGVSGSSGIYRKVVRDEIDFLFYLREQKKIDCFSSIFSEWQIRRRMFDLVYLDIDDHSGVGDGYKKMKDVVDILGEEGVRVYFSGRGYHVFYFFPMVRLEHYGDVVRRFMDNCGVLSLVDRVVVGDMRRLARLPGTVNSKVGKVVEYLYGDGYCDWWKELVSMDKSFGRRNGDAKEYMSRLDCSDFDISEFPPCVREGIEVLVSTGELEHLWRLSVAIFLLKVWGKEKTMELFKTFADDFNYSITEYQLNWLLRRSYKCFSCRKLKDLGICSVEFEKCPWYKLSSGWIERLVGDVYDV